MDALVRLALYETLNIDSFTKLNKWAKRKQMNIEDPQGVTADYIALWLKYQKRLEKNKCLNELKSSVNILNKNSFESNEPIFEGMTAASLLDSVYDQFENSEIGDDDLYKIQEKLGVLLQTKTLNPPSFFSLSFKIGIYLPILAPFALPILMTIWLVLVGKL